METSANVVFPVTSNVDAFTSPSFNITDSIVTPLLLVFSLMVSTVNVPSVVMLLEVKSPSTVTLSDISTVSEMCTDPLTSSVLFGFRVPIPNCWKLMLRYITYIYIILYF